MTQKIANDVYWVGVRDASLVVFDIVVPTEHGTTYNSYLIKGEKHNVLLDTSKKDFSETYFANLEEICPVKEIDYVVVHHTEPDHSGALKELLQRNPDITVIHSRPCRKFLDNLLNQDFKSWVISSGDTLDLGGKTLKFFVTPFLHWPDTMMSYLEEEQILFSCDFMGAHYTTEKTDSILNSALSEEDHKDMVEAFEFYYSMIMRPYNEHILKAIKMLDELEIRMVAPSHGMVMDKNPQQFYEWYREKANNYLVRLQSKRATIVYASAYGNTARVMEFVREGMEDAGVEVDVFDTSSAPMEQIINSIELASAVVFGTSTINAKAPEPIFSVIANLVVLNVSGRKAAVFGSFGWSGEGITMCEDLCRAMHMKLEQEPFRVQMTPSDEQLDQAREWGYGLGLKVLG
ncbi:FprA family A-type flavoprotein [Desulfurispira natronophila]|uniref:Flavorubredoxin n=1 Tax=Desulfurispira natronophila TaxID=682562 RepID=A0A7W7Y5X7_9BACT|nr:FprA family A-type flavoprotein [Desulfurispira natronophila]MBB5022686.1 flavorubredoxin [Desulfurispira natronophila]